MSPLPIIEVLRRANGLRSWLRVALVFGLSIVGARATDLAATPRAVGRSAHVGDEACRACHADKVVSYHRTAHALTSQPATPFTIKGRFTAGANTLRTANPDLYFQMELKDGGAFQTAIVRTSPTEAMTRSEPFAYVVGSGRKGQTYLYWDGDLLLQLPVSYSTQQDAWVNSPGYIDGTVDFERPIARRCLECHASAFVSRAPPEHAYDRARLVPGISCEKCHGPGGEHVALYQSATPPAKPADGAIVNPARLPRERQIDTCALCHAGAGNRRTPPLSYQPGEVLADHLTFPPQPAGAHIDVHASQVQLMERSRCFQASGKMTCATCHNVHQTERDLPAMAAKCTSCHQAERCGMFAKQGPAIAGRCVNCHMPLEETVQIVIAGNRQRSLPQVRNHQIAIYPGAGGTK